MPFKSRKQERYLQINEPDIYEDWVEEYGHFKGAEAFSADFLDPCYVFFGKDDEKPILVKGLELTIGPSNKGWAQEWAHIQIEQNRTWPSKSAAKEAFMRWLKKEKCWHTRQVMKWDDVKKYGALSYEKYNIPFEEITQVRIVEDEVEWGAESFSAEECGECGHRMAPKWVEYVCNCGHTEMNPSSISCTNCGGGELEPKWIEYVCGCGNTKGPTDFWSAESFSAEGIDGSRAKSDDYWLYHGHNSDGSWCGQKLWVSKGQGYDYLCSCNATLYRGDAVLSAKNPKKLPEPKDPKTTPYGTIFIHEFMSEAESFSAESGQMCGVCFGNDDLPYDSDHFTDCRRCGKSVCIDCDGEMEYHPDWFKVCGECDNILENVSIHGAESFSADSLSEDEKILLKKLRDKRTDIPRKYRDALIDFQEKSGKKRAESFAADDFEPIDWNKIDGCKYCGDSWCDSLDGTGLCPVKDSDQMDAESFGAENESYVCLENGKTYRLKKRMGKSRPYGWFAPPLSAGKGCFNCGSKKCIGFEELPYKTFFWPKRKNGGLYGAESFSAENWKEYVQEDGKLYVIPKWGSWSINTKEHLGYGSGGRRWVCKDVIPDTDYGISGYQWPSDRSCKRCLKWSEHNDYHLITMKDDEDVWEYYHYDKKGLRAEFFSAELKRDSCCCGATKSKPCACMIEGVMECSAGEPKCPCYAAKGAESFSADVKKGAASSISPYNTQRKLDAIWRQGDRDEGSIKHIQYTLTALADGRDWNTQHGYTSMNTIPRVQEKWGEIQLLRDELGGEQFKELIEETKFGETVSYPDWKCLCYDCVVNKSKAESFSAERDFACADCGEVIIDDDYDVSDEGAILCGGQFGNNCADAESFNSYKVAPDLSSYTKAELLSSIAGPQGTASYQEVVYDPIAQSRMSAETATQRFEDYGNSLAGDSVCPACGSEDWDESYEDEGRGYCGCGHEFSVDSATANPLLTFYELEALKEQGTLTSDQKEYLEWTITSTLRELDSSSLSSNHLLSELVAHGWTLNRWGNAEPPKESASTLVVNAEGIDSFSPTRLMVLGASVGAIIGLYTTRGD